MASPFVVDQLRYPTAARPAEFDFSAISRLGDAIGAYRQKQAMQGALAEATDPQGNVDFNKAAAALTRLGAIDQAAPFLRLAEARSNRAEARGARSEALAETERHHRAIEGIAGQRAGTAAETAASKLTLKYEGELDDETTKAIAEQYRAGDTSVLVGLAKDPRNIIRVRKEIARQNNEFGITAAEQALRNAEFMGEKAGQRTVAQRTAGIEIAANEFKRVLPIVTEASNSVNRTNYPSLNKIIQAYQEGTGDPNIVKFASGVNSLVNLYARAISPTGTPTVSDKDHAREILNKAWSNGQFDAATGIMTQEIDAALKAPADVKQHMRERFQAGQAGSKQAPAATPPAAPAQAAPAVPRKVQSTAEANEAVGMVRARLREMIDAGGDAAALLRQANDHLRSIGAPTISSP